ncbi:MAG: FkbM family methyltransferase [Hydrococcus sp. RU_2_2]|nr:FkbM family methyltransferase [Hydrococcus sp. RU_2_2]
MVKTVIKKLVRNLGFELKRYKPNLSETARMQQLLAYHKIDLVFDIGANIGQYAMFLREIGYSGRIVSFEPLSSAHAQLQALSSKDPLWEIAPRMAIGDRDDNITIQISANSQSSSVLEMLESHVKASPKSAYIDSETVQMCKLDTVAREYIQNNTTSIFLKIDVQGFEKQALEGATQTLSQVKGIQVELSLAPLYRDQLLFKEMLALVENLGYEPHAFVPGFTDLETGRLLQMDGIFFKQ